MNLLDFLLQLRSTFQEEARITQMSQKEEGGIPLTLFGTQSGRTRYAPPTVLSANLLCIAELTIANRLCLHCVSLIDSKPGRKLSLQTLLSCQRLAVSASAESQACKGTLSVPVAPECPVCTSNLLVTTGATLMGAYPSLCCNLVDTKLCSASKQDMQLLAGFSNIHLRAVWMST